MQTRRQLFKALTAALLAFLMIGNDFALAAPPPGKGGGGGGDGGGSTIPTLPPIAYEVTFLPVSESSIVEDINNNLQVVGWSVVPFGDAYDDVGFIYDHATGAVQTLQDLVSDETLATIAAAGFTQSKFRGINDAGVLVGYVGNDDYTSSDGIIVDLSTGKTGDGSYARQSVGVTFTSSLGYDTSYLLHINNSHEVVGGYFSNGTWWNTFVATYDSPTALVSGVQDLGVFDQVEYRSTISDTGLVMLGSGSGSTGSTWEYDINNVILRQVSSDTDRLKLSAVDSVGRYAGTKHVVAKNKSTTLLPVVFDPESADSVIWQATHAGDAHDINDPSVADLANGVILGDVLYAASGNSNPLFLYSPAWGEVNIDDLLDPSDPDREAWLGLSSYRNPRMTQKLETNFGAIAGSGVYGLVPFILTPRPYIR